MTTHTDSIVTFIIMWGIPAFMVVRGYLKMNTDDRKSVVHDFRTPRFIFTIGLLIMGAFLTQLSIVFTIHAMKAIGIGLLSIGGIFSIVNLWKDSKIKSIGLLLLLSFLMFLITQLLQLF
ncbi:hypothetical protein ACQKL5_08145 [Peribacillus sp. NPDC097675]|uniref:hypothetical protein n=1 Tax=Peribacillus sp. NPDC097675 TaxID=3390618 RepID=UPI003CFE2E95